RISAEEEPPQPAAAEVFFALHVLDAVAVGGALDVVGNVEQPGLVGVGAPAEAGIAFVIGQIQVAGIVALNVVAAVAVRVVPADDIDGIGKVGATGPAIAGEALVLIPGAVQRLGIAEGIGRPRAGYYPQDAGARRTGTGAERGLLIDEGHGDGHGHAPAL